MTDNQSDTPTQDDPTPLTDAAVVPKPIELYSEQLARVVSVSRNLERQLSAARRELEAERAKNAAPYWMIERKAAHGEPPAWWAGGPDFGRAAYCWTSDAANGIKFHDAPSATAAHIALMALRGIKQANREFHIERVTITEHMMWTPSAL